VRDIITCAISKIIVLSRNCRRLFFAFVFKKIEEINIISVQIYLQIGYNVLHSENTLIYTVLEIKIIIINKKNLNAYISYKNNIIL